MIWLRKIACYRQHCLYVYSITPVSFISWCVLHSVFCDPSLKRDWSHLWLLSNQDICLLTQHWYHFIGSSSLTVIHLTSCWGRSEAYSIRISKHESYIQSLFFCLFLQYSGNAHIWLQVQPEDRGWGHSTWQEKLWLPALGHCHSVSGV